ncbi:UNVERIFIED_CONTAM: circularly permuted type 2 ATP-grasp protein [Methylobacteriaceae bacterium AG10]|nr:circularly permuted type 2 ATP-grasp protein [Methylobacteriaceae bacterium AG10]
MTASAALADGPARPDPDAAAEDPAARMRRWTEAYAPRPGLADALMDAEGTLRGGWPRFLERLARLDDREVAARFLSAERHIRDAGISYRVYGDGREHPWPLGSLPLVIDAADWAELSAGIVQRAGLMERIVADIYGAGRLVAEGFLPAGVVAGHPEFLRPVHGIAPPGGRWLPIYAADVGRGPDGRWQVLADRTQAPSGLGYALENRMVLARAFPDLFADLHVERLPGFFQAFRAGLAASCERSDPRICLLTSGPYSSTYVEQAALARYLGFLLVEGDDLVVRDGLLHVRTIAGLKRTDAVWRRIDADYLDPMELRSDSRLGVPGILQVLRRGGTVVGNMPGSGVLESAALGPYLPAIARRLTGEELRLAGPRTWWCGDPEGLAHALANLDRLTLRPAATPLRGPERDAMLAGPVLDAARARAVASLRERPFDWVAQEPAPLSTMPAWQDGRLVPRPFVMRVFAAATPEGWRVLPSAFCRVAERDGADPTEMRAGIRSADVWVLSDTPVDTPTLLHTSAPRIRRIAGHLPSRAADNLFWFGRYLERAEAVIRLVQAHLGVFTEAVAADACGEEGAPTARAIRALLKEWDSVSAADLAPAALAQEALSGKTVFGSGLAHVMEARRIAASLRERLPAESWRALADLRDTLVYAEGWTPTEAQLFGKAERALGHLAALSGLLHENMGHAAGWRFADMGRRIERAINTCGFALRFCGPDASAEDLGVMLSLADSQIAYGARYLVGVSRDAVCDMAVLDPNNPRSVAYQLQAITAHLDALPALAADGLPEPHRRRALALAVTLQTAEAAALDAETLERFETDLEALADRIAGRYFPNGPDALRPEKLTGLA